MIILNIPAPQNDFIDTVLESPRDAKITITDLKMNVDAEPLVGRKLTLIIVNKCVLDLSINSNSNTGRPELSMSVETLDISVFDEKGKNVGLIENLASWLKDIIFSSVQEALNNLFKEVTMTVSLSLLLIFHFKILSSLLLERRQSPSTCRCITHLILVPSIT